MLGFSPEAVRLSPSGFAYRLSCSAREDTSLSSAACSSAAPATVGFGHHLVARRRLTVRRRHRPEPLKRSPDRCPDIRFQLFERVYEGVEVLGDGCEAVLLVVGVVGDLQCRFGDLFGRVTDGLRTRRNDVSRFRDFVGEAVELAAGLSSSSTMPLNSLAIRSIDSFSPSVAIRSVRFPAAVSSITSENSSAFFWRYLLTSRASARPPSVCHARPRDGPVSRGGARNRVARLDSLARNLAGVSTSTVPLSHRSVLGTAGDRRAVRPGSPAPAEQHHQRRPTSHSGSTTN